MPGKLDNVQLFYGETMPSLARLYARLPGTNDQALALTGEVLGPKCRWARTLETTAPMRTLRGAAELTAECMLPDPCFWSDDLPMLYNVRLTLRNGSEVLETAERSIGIRTLGPRGASLFRQGKRWVPRGVYASGDARSSSEAEIKPCILAYRDASAVLCIDSPTDALCAAASESGAWIIAEVVESTEAAVIAELARLARHAAVMMAIVPHKMRATAAMRTAAPNILLAETLSTAVDSNSWPIISADCLIADADILAQVVSKTAARPPRPVIARRRLPEGEPLADARLKCDRLQADLAAIGDWAGYLV